MNAQTPPNQKQDYIEIARLFVDDRYQRDYDEVWARKIADCWNDDDCTLLIVADRGDRYAVIDGQHRLGAAIMRGIDYLPCLVYSGYTAEQEAHLFEAINTQRRGVHVISVFKNRLFQGQREAMDIKAIVEQFGMSIPNKQTRAVDGQIVAVGALQHVYRHHGAAHLRLVISILNRAWDGDQSAFQAMPIKGLSLFCARYHGQYDEQTLINRLRGHTPAGIKRNATNLKEITTVNADGAWAQTVLAVYNKGLTTRRLAEWVSKVKIAKPRQQAGDGELQHHTGVRKAVS